MHWFYKNKHKSKLSALFVGLVVLVMLVGIIGLSTVGKLSDSFKTLYDDRLVPERNVAKMMELFYETEIGLESFVYSNADVVSPELVQRAIAKRKTDLNLLIAELAETYLVDDEKLYLQQFKDSYAAYKEVEKEIIRLKMEGKGEEAEKMLQQKGQESLHSVISHLQELMNIQLEVGKTLYTDVENITGNVKVLFLVIMGIALVSVIIVGLYLTFYYYE
ncbi:MCP four helix bundle domain-containing protein [Penaeicola halotolerans]|uniref:MCP four helix bundle domain-containing protein n=1 Tax=Penaeicola halotolerans TaxID=2793196 RepID=UPI001CF8E7BC|nr:MCP four helix bundle domain-containing protein [Penaeicola halotolerans]